MRKILTSIAVFTLLFIQFSVAQKKKVDQPKQTLIEITTDYGVMKLKLYDATPQHRDNFLKLANEGFFDSLLFHRVINGFMIQGGDPQSKNAAPGIPLGNGDVGYTIPAEFNDSLFHKKGALCAARTENPEKASSGCQFYIVQGKILNDGELNQMEMRINNGRKQTLFQQYINQPENAELKATFTRYQQEQKRDSLNNLIQTVVEPALNKMATPFAYSEAQREAYKTIGGTPSLDQGYTVYGEVVEGLDVIDKIAAVKTASADRPETDVRMKVKVITQ